MKRIFRNFVARVFVASSLGAALALVIAGYSLRAEISTYWQQRRIAARFAAAETSPPLAVDNPPRPESFHPVRALPAQPPILQFAVVSALAADEHLQDGELVLGVEVGGEARAYPLNMLNGPSREILNDTLGGRAIAATW